MLGHLTCEKTVGWLVLYRSFVAPLEASASSPGWIALESYQRVGFKTDGERL